MPLSNAQYDEIMHEYDERQLHNRHILETRRAEVLKKLPRLKEIDASVASSSVRQARLHLDGDTNALASLKQELSALSLERQQLLTASGYPADYLDPVYTSLRIYFVNSSNYCFFFSSQIFISLLLIIC